jgi:hypothetical protein
MPSPVGPTLNDVAKMDWYAGPQGEFTTAIASPAMHTSKAPGTASWGKNPKIFESTAGADIFTCGWDKCDGA